MVSSSSAPREVLGFGGRLGRSQKGLRSQILRTFESSMLRHQTFVLILRRPIHTADQSRVEWMMYGAGMSTGAGKLKLSVLFTVLYETCSLRARAMPLFESGA